MKGYQRTKFINGKTYVLVIGHVVGKKDGKVNGNPSLVRIMRDEDIVHLAGGEEFITMYVPEDTFKV